jgi:5-methyltetrahydrofolate--homocysteine methyltransferase
MWGHIARLQAKFAEDPNIHFSITDLGGILDIVASLRGTESLLYDLYDYPDEVRRFTEQVKAFWFEAFRAQLETVSQTGQPYNNWMNIPSAKPWYPLQCDFCYMISPAQFAQFVLPDLTEQAAAMPRSIYHLDGVGEIPHLDMILDIPGITGIQWVAGPSQPPLWDAHWFDLYRRIQDKQKNLVLLGGLSGASEADIERLIKTLDPTGLYISHNCRSRDEAEDLLEKITHWSE